MQKTYLQKYNIELRWNLRRLFRKHMQAIITDSLSYTALEGIISVAKNSDARIARYKLKLESARKSTPAHILSYEDRGLHLKTIIEDELL